jgi:hypothetical protein
MDIKRLADTEPWEWPGDAGQTILAALTNRTTPESERLEAAEMAGDLIVMNEDIAGALISILTNPAEPEKLRAQAAIAFGPVLEQAEIDFDEPEQLPISVDTLVHIAETLHRLFSDDGTPKELRRRILEASVRAEQDWHADAIAAAWASGDPEWVLTSVFAMRYVPGFEDQILAALKNPDPDTHFEAVQGAGARELDGAWPHIVALLKNRGTPKQLLLAAIEAAGIIRPQEAGEVLYKLAESRDEEIAEAANEAIADAEARVAADAGEDEDEDDDWVN